MHSVLVVLLVTIACTDLFFADASCGMKWAEVLHTDSQGKVLSGSKSQLKEAVFHGARIKIRNDNKFISDTDNCRILDDEICCQSLRSLSYQDWENFQDKIYWWMTNVCTSGFTHMTRHFVGGAFHFNSLTKIERSWIVLRNEDGSYPNPVYSTGSVQSECRFNDLVRDVRRGKPVSIVQDGEIGLPIQRLTMDPNKRMISAEHVWTVSDTDKGTHFEFTKPAFWMYHVLSSSGIRKMSVWAVGSDMFKGIDQITIPMDWYVDDCWTEVPNAPRNLMALVEAGHAVRVRIGRKISDADSIRLTNNAVSAQLVAQTSNAIGSNSDNLVWEFQTVSTSSTVRTYRPFIGFNVRYSLGTLHSTANDLSWFVDTKTWTMLFHQSVDGSVIAGSPSAVRLAAEAGVDVRVGYKLAGDPGFRFARPDNINFGPSPHLSAQIVRYLNEKQVNDQEFELDISPEWSFTLVNTKGYVRSSLWEVGAHINQGRTMQRAEVKWFASF